MEIRIEKYNKIVDEQTVKYNNYLEEKRKYEEQKGFSSYLY
jgi:hypothetical protein